MATKPFSELNCFGAVAIAGLIAMVFACDLRAGMTIRADACADTVRLQAQGEKLSVVMTALARRLGFELSFDSAADRQVSFDRELPAAELVGQLLRHDNFGMQQEADPDCEQLDRITRVWVLPKGEGGKVSRVTARPSDPVAALRESNGLPARPNYPVRDPDSRSHKSSDNEIGRKRRRDMTPEERYNDRINRQMRKKYDLE